MEELKQQRIADAKRRMQETKTQLQTEKQNKLKDVKNTIQNERPQGTGSCIGESMNDYMTPVKARIGGAASAMNSPRNRNDLTAGSNDDQKQKSKNKDINKALIEKAKKAAPMTERANTLSGGNKSKKPGFSFNFAGITEEEKKSEGSNSTDLKANVMSAAGSEDNISFDLNADEINVQ